MTETISNFLGTTNDKYSHIEIILGNKLSDNIFDKSYNNDELLNNLVKNYNFETYDQVIYKKNREEYIVKNYHSKEENMFFSNQYIDNLLSDNYCVNLYLKENISCLNFSCDKNYDCIYNAKVTEFKINSLKINFIEDKTDNYVKFIIDNDSYINDSLLKLKELLDISI